MTVGRYDIHWVTRDFANGIVNAWHSHLPMAVGAIYSLGAFDDVGECVGVVMVSRPVARPLDDERTAEVSRLATNHAANAASALLGRARRVAKTMGFRRMTSYTLVDEEGTSYKAAGWTPIERIAPRVWGPRAGRPRANVVAEQGKIRWEVAL